MSCWQRASSSARAVPQDPAPITAVGPGSAVMVWPGESLTLGWQGYAVMIDSVPPLPA